MPTYCFRVRIFYKRANIDGEEVSRKYTPISSIHTKGKVEVLIKVYYKNEIFPNGGKMSQYVDRLKLNETIDVRGPFGILNYLGDGEFEKGTKSKQKFKFNELLLIGGGTGITPLYQVNIF